MLCFIGSRLLFFVCFNVTVLVTTSSSSHDGIEIELVTVPPIRGAGLSRYGETDD